MKIRHANKSDLDEITALLSSVSFPLTETAEKFFKQQAFKPINRETVNEDEKN